MMTRIEARRVNTLKILKMLEEHLLMIKKLYLMDMITGEEFEERMMNLVRMITSCKGMLDKLDILEYLCVTLGV